MYEDQWWHAYDQGLKWVIHEASFAHPAKYSWALINRMYAHALDEGWVQRGSLVVDPMAGVAIGGLAAAIHGLTWVGIELEPRFVTMGRENIALHANEWVALGKPVPYLQQGDARALREMIAPAGLQAECVVSSPPYANSVDSQSCGIDWTKMGPATGKRERGPGTKHHETLTAQLSYQSPSKLRALGAQEHEIQQAIRQPQAIVSSPPFVAQMNNGGDTPTARGEQRRGRDTNGASSINGFGTSLAQLGAMREGTYWEAMRVIYAASYDVLPTGGHIMLVLKSYIRRGAIVDLPMQTAALLEHVGFTVLHAHRAMLTSPVGQAHLFDDGEDRTSRKSFFRRLAERKGAPVIDHEVVLCGVKH